MKLTRDELEDIIDRDPSRFRNFEDGGHFSYYALDESVPTKFDAKLRSLGYIRKRDSLEWDPDRLDEVEALANSVFEAYNSDEGWDKLDLDLGGGDDVDYCGTYILSTIEVLRTLGEQREYYAVFHPDDPSIALSKKQGVPINHGLRNPGMDVWLRLAIQSVYDNMNLPWEVRHECVKNLKLVLRQEAIEDINAPDGRLLTYIDTVVFG